MEPAVLYQRHINIDEWFSIYNAEDDEQSPDISIEADEETSPYASGELFSNNAVDDEQSPDLIEADKATSPNATFEDDSSFDDDIPGMNHENFGKYFDHYKQVMQNNDATDGEDSQNDATESSSSSSDDNASSSSDDNASSSSDDNASSSSDDNASSSSHDNASSSSHDNASSSSSSSSDDNTSSLIATNEESSFSSDDESDNNEIDTVYLMRRTTEDLLKLK